MQMQNIKKLSFSAVICALAVVAVLAVHFPIFAVAAPFLEYDPGDIFVLVAGLGRNTFNAVLALGIVYVPMLTRLTRSLTLVEKNKVYVSACVSLGYSDTRILYRHILPNCISTILVQLTLDVAYAILDLASLSFLGLGTLPPQADWGAMLDEGRSVLLMSPVQSLSAGIVIVIVVVSLNIFSDGLHQYLDQAQTALPSFRKYEKKFLKKKGGAADGKPA